MRGRRRWRAVGVAIVLGLLLMGAAGCRRKPGAPSGTKPVGAADRRIREAAPALEEWVSLWQAAIPGFKPESLYFGGTAGALRGYVQPLKNMYPPLAGNDVVFEILSAESPDRRYWLVFDWYQGISEEEGKIEIGGDADSAPLLLDRRDGVSNQFASCGTPCGFHWGAWLSPTRFVLGGWTELNPEGSRLRGTLDIYSIQDSTVASYVTKPLSREAYERYRNAWEGWVLERYRARKRQAHLGPSRRRSF